MQTNFETVRYMAGNKMRYFKVSKSNPRNFVIGNRCIVIGTSECEQICSSEKNAKKLNESIVSGDLIRRVYN
jgi:hypothetical protein